MMLVFLVADEGVESGTETENGQLPRISLNLQRHVLSAAFLKALNEKLAGQRIEEIVSEGDMRERIVPGLTIFLFSVNFSVFGNAI